MFTCNPCTCRTYGQAKQLVQEPLREHESSNDVIDIDTYVPKTNALVTLAPYWIPGLELREDDKEILLSGKWLTDKHISATNKLLQKQHPQQNGLQDTITTVRAVNLEIKHPQLCSNHSRKRKSLGMCIKQWMWL